jgi:hypothetical protein
MKTAVASRPAKATSITAARPRSRTSRSTSGTAETATGYLDSTASEYARAATTSQPRWSWRAHLAIAQNATAIPAAAGTSMTAKCPSAITGPAATASATAKKPARGP